MIRLRRWSVLVVLILTCGLLSALRGQAPPATEKKNGDKPVEKWLEDRSLAVTPAVQPVPALKYRLYPSNMERKEGNAVPIYLRFAHERIDARKQQLRDEPYKWNKLPLEKLPLDEVKKFLDNGRLKYELRQLDLGARRRTADWSYTLDAGDPIGMLLPDMQEMRIQAPLLVLKARVEIAEHRYADALHTLETGFSFSQQISEAPFLISALVGIACAYQFTDCLLQLIERPDAPNVYWALTVLPRPLIDLRWGFEFEHELLELQFPDLADLDRPHSTEEWDAAFARILTSVRKEFKRLTEGSKNVKPPKPGNTPGDPASKSPDLPAARKYLAEVVGMSAVRIDAMPPAEVLLRYMQHLYHELRDELFKCVYVPYPQSRRLAQEAEARLKSAPDTEAGQIATMLLPAVLKVRVSQNRLERKLAALRVIEALRMHAAAHGGQLPDKLDEVTIVPVPNDPGTGQPFEYQRDSQTATIISRIPGESLQIAGLRYRVTIRK
jgi:hypothetical protein